MPVKKKVVKRRTKKTGQLTDKQLLFCFEYLVDMNGAAAVRRAGYQCKSLSATTTKACELLKVPEIKSVIKAGLKAKIEKSKIDAQWVLDQSVRVYERCMQDEAVLDNDGNKTGEYKFEHSGANKALDAIGKNVGVQAFKEKVEVNASKDLLDFLAAIPSTTGPPSER